MPALPLDTAGPYVAGAYLVFLGLILAYVGIMASKLGRIERDLGELERLVAAQDEHAPHGDADRIAEAARTVAREVAPDGVGSRSA